MYILKKKEGTTSDELIGKCLSKDESFNVDDLRIKFNYVKFLLNFRLNLKKIKKLLFLVRLLKIRKIRI